MNQVKKMIGIVSAFIIIMMFTRMYLSQPGSQLTIIAATVEVISSNETIQGAYIRCKKDQVAELKNNNKSLSIEQKRLVEQHLPDGCKTAILAMCKDHDPESKMCRFGLTPYMAS